jgi:hypothetical protein
MHHRSRLWWWRTLKGRGVLGDAEESFDYATLPLESAYSHYQQDWPAARGGGRAEPAYTTWKHRPPAELCRVIDYIWFTRGTARCPGMAVVWATHQI